MRNFLAAKGKGVEHMTTLASMNLYTIHKSCVLLTHFVGEVYWVIAEVITHQLILIRKIDL